MSLRALLFLSVLMGVAACSHLVSNDEPPPDLHSEDQTTEEARVVENHVVPMVEGSVESQSLKDPTPAAQSEIFKAVVLSSYWTQALSEAKAALPPGYEVEMGEVKELEPEEKMNRISLNLRARRIDPCPPEVSSCEPAKSLGELVAAIDLPTNAAPIVINWVKFVKFSPPVLEGVTEPTKSESNAP